MKKDFNNTPKKTWAAPNIEDLDLKKTASGSFSSGGEGGHSAGTTVPMYS